MTQAFFGKYRGTVTNNIDPQQIGRIQASVAAVSVVPLSWAMPCLPWGGPNTGLFTVPPVGAGVWIEFEGGDPDRPVWTGCWWGNAAEVPMLARTVPPGVSGLTLQTTAQNGLVVSDVPGPSGGIQISTTGGARISVTDAGIVISNGRGAAITLTGNVVDINAGALTVL